MGLRGGDYTASVIIEQRVGGDEHSFIVIPGPVLEYLLDLCVYHTCIEIYIPAVERLKSQNGGRVVQIVLLGVHFGMLLVKERAEFLLIRQELVQQLQSFRVE